ncbi:MAG: hypothetical protein ABIL76_06190, partial [candidate division WOR-3 bacterium]
MTDLIKLYESLKEKIGEETAKLLVDAISKIYSNGYIKNEQFIEVIRAIEGRIKSFEDMVKFEFSNIWQELKQLRETSATKDDIKRLEERIEKIEASQENFATKDDIRELKE